MKTDNFRNLFVTQAGDMRNVLLLIAWCVVVMRNIKDTPNVAEQRRVSIEAAYLYAPLAHKLGLYTLKSELEDLSLKYLEHDAYYMIKETLTPRSVHAMPISNASSHLLRRCSTKKDYATISRDARCAAREVRMDPAQAV